MEEVRVGDVYYSMSNTSNPFERWFLNIPAKDLEIYGMVPQDLRPEAQVLLRELALVRSTQKGPGNIFLRPKGKYLAPDRGIFLQNEGLAQGFQVIHELMSFAKKEFINIVLFLDDKNISIAEKKKYIYAFAEDELAAKKKINIKNYKSINQSLINARKTNLINFAKDFQFADEKVFDVFPGLIEGYMAYEFIYKIFLEELERYEKHLRDQPASIKNHVLILSGLSLREQAILLKSLAQSVDILQPFAEEFLALVLDKPVNLPTAENKILNFNFCNIDIIEIIEPQVSKANNNTNIGDEKIIEPLNIFLTEPQIVHVEQQNSIEEEEPESQELLKIENKVVLPNASVLRKNPHKKTESEKREALLSKKEAIYQKHCSLRSVDDVNKAPQGKNIISCLCEKEWTMIVDSISNNIYKKLLNLFDHKNVNLLFSTNEVYTLAKAIAEQIEIKQPAIAALFLKQLKGHLHAAHASDTGNKLKDDYIDKLRPFFIMVGIVPKNWTPVTSNDLVAQQKYFLRVLEAKKRKQW